MEGRGINNWFKLKQLSTYIDFFVFYFYFFNIDFNMQKMLYTNLLVTKNEKPVKDMQKIKRKESKSLI